MNQDLIVRIGCFLAILWVLRKFIATCKPSRVLPYGAFETSTVPDINILRTMLQQRVKYIKCRRRWLDPANQAVMSKVESLIPTATYANIPAMLELLPGNRFGMLPLEKLPASPPPILFQFEQGRIGWYFGYLTFPNQTSSVFFQLSRHELLPRSEREKFWALGNSTLYSILIGLGVNGKYYRSSYWATPGSFVAPNPQTFTFTIPDGSFSLTHAAVSGGGYQMNLAFSTNLIPVDQPAGSPSTSTVASFTLTSTVPMYPDGANWCQPCLFGDGTLYGSYTNFHGSGTVSMSGGTVTSPISTTLNNGVGWMDHQWGGSEPTSAFGRLVWTILQKGVPMSALSRYLWINLHVSDQLQYMVVAFPSSVPKLGDTISCAFNKYTPDSQKFIQSGAKATVMQTKSFDGTDWPVSYKIIIEGQTYTLDGSAYGTECIVDQNNSNHWVGSGNLLDNNGNLIGTGFMEQCRYFPDTTYYNNLWIQAGSTESGIVNWYASQKDNASYIGCIIVLIGLVILFLVHLYLLIRSGWTVLKFN